MKKKLLLFMYLISIFIFCGCVDTNMTIDIDKKGNTTLYSDILVKDSMFKNLSEEEINKLKSKYDKVEKITSPGKSGYRVTEKVENLKNIKGNKLSEIKGAEEFKNLVDLKIDKKIFYSIYNIKFNIKDYMLENANSSTSIEQDKTVLTAIKNSSNVNFNLNLPIKLIESNATTSSESNGKYIYSWNYTLNNMDNIYVKAKVYNVQNIILSSFIVIVVIAVVTILIIRMKRNNARMD